MELAHQVIAPNGPYSKSQVARALGFARAGYYRLSRQALKDKKIAVAIEEQYERDDTLGHRKLAVLLHIGNNRAKRGMKKYGITARRKKKRYGYPGKAATMAPNLVRQQHKEASTDVVFSDIFEISLADGSRVRGCFALWRRTRHILALACDDRLKAELVVATIQMLPFAVPGTIWHSDQGSQ